MDKLFIRGLQLKTTIGCLNWEKQILQTVIIDLEMGVDCAHISKSDDIAATLDYVKLSDDLKRFAGEAKFDLIETLVEKMATFIHQHYPDIKHLKLTLEKPGALPGAKTVGVVIERTFA